MSDFHNGWMAFWNEFAVTFSWRWVGFITAVVVFGTLGQLLLAFWRWLSERG